MSRVGKIESQKEWLIIQCAVKEFHRSGKAKERPPSKKQDDQLSHFAKQGVKVRLK